MASAATGAAFKAWFLQSVAVHARMAYRRVSLSAVMGRRCSRRTGSDRVTSQRREWSSLAFAATGRSPKARTSGSNGAAETDARPGPSRAPGCAQRQSAAVAWR
jgi:hypothetical protein